MTTHEINLQGLMDVLSEQIDMRKRKGITRTSIAANINVGRDTMSNYLNGHRVMPMDVFVKVLAELDLTFEDLARLVESHKP